MAAAQRKPRIVLAYSGGLDTTVAIPWLKEQFDADVITLTVDVGQPQDMEEARRRAVAIGAKKALVVDGREVFLREFVWPAFKAGAVYEGVYPLATALSRPLIARCLAEAAQKEGAFAVAHGCTGKGNDQVRIELGIMALAPDVKVIAPAREWGMSREEEVEYLRQRKLPTPPPKTTKYSIDENLWGRSVEAGPLEDPWNEPPEEAYAWTASAAKTPAEPAYLELEFTEGVLASISGETADPIGLVEHLNTLAGRHGVGRIDHLEDRLVGIKSREVYEAPAAVVLHKARAALEAMTLTKEQLRFRDLVAQQYADLVYNGQWFSAHRQDLDAYAGSLMQYVSGTVRVRLHRGNATVVGRKSPHALYSYQLATYDKADTFDHKASGGFIQVYGLPIKTQNRRKRAGRSP
ncbi:MAG: argininosuccinate synthase [Dehalococcoidia bacterium]|nr:argininosuccinate synthase [Dehalococcoidia bacterium]